ncbi:hypothetical protein F4775DRAFT_583729 [Biscogniauxia sp. FL1348]|nr:hypothetical protein F4775DRAFT_583729 [Biscogniauxia sp. FL1348]
MLSEKEIDDAAQQLAEYQTQNALSEILGRYSNLIASYKRLKSDYEEEREAREKYKQMARGQERNPFVLVLVDGDGYIFNDEVVAAGSEGGTRAAQQLNDAIKVSLRRKGLESCEVMIRVYANLVGLSKTLSKAGLCGPEKRSLAPFSASFTRSYGLTDFIDAGELKENADYKLRAMLHLYAENAQCKHIYFAACHDVGYVSELTPYRGSRDRFTLVSTPGILFHDEFGKLGLGIEELPGVFRNAVLGQNSVQARPAPSTAMAMASSSSPAISTATSATAEGQKPCSYFTIGKCRYGKACKNLHATTKSSTSFGGNHTSLPYQSTRSESIGSDPTHSKIDPFAQLPRKEDIPYGYVALNQNQQRLDPYIPSPTATIMARLKERSAGRKLCNNKHLTDSCHNEDCEYDHDMLEEDLKPALEFLSRSLPCPKREKCRNYFCSQGHICQNPDCKHRGGKSKAYCKIPYAIHMADLTFHRFVLGSPNRPTMDLQSPPESLSGDEGEDGPGSAGAEL